MKRARRFATLLAEFVATCVAAVAFVYGAIKLGENSDGPDWYFRMMYFLVALVVVLILAACWGMSKERK